MTTSRNEERALLVIDTLSLSELSVYSIYRAMTGTT